MDSLPLSGRSIGVGLVSAVILAASHPAPLGAQRVEEALDSVVRIMGTRGGGTPVRGSGFVVSLDQGTAIVVTSSHVIEGLQFEVTFSVDASRSHTVSPADIIKIETQNINGLAAFRVRGPLPSQVRALPMASGDGPGIGTSLFLVGYPQMTSTPLAVSRVFSGRDGQRMVIDQPVGEGFSGGPVLAGGRVVGLVTDTDNQFTYAMTFVAVREFLLGSGVRLDAPPTGGDGAPGSKKLPPPTPEERTRNYNRRLYTVNVLGVPNADAAITAMRAAGYAANLYGPTGRPADQFQVISIGARVPVPVAQELLSIARSHLPALRYVILGEDRSDLPADGSRNTEIAFGVTNRILDDFAQVTPLPAGGWQRLAEAPDEDTFVRTVRAYYRPR
jgi:hypothetical protein